MFVYGAVLLIQLIQLLPITGPGGAEGASAPLRSSLLMCPFLLMSPLNVLFLKEITQNVHENQQAKSQAS